MAPATAADMSLGPSRGGSDGGGAYRYRTETCVCGYAICTCTSNVRGYVHIYIYRKGGHQHLTTKGQINRFITNTTQCVAAPLPYVCTVTTMLMPDPGNTHMPPPPTHTLLNKAAQHQVFADTHIPECSFPCTPESKIEPQSPSRARCTSGQSFKAFEGCQHS